MDKVLAVTEEMTNLIEKSDIYKSYISAKNEIYADSELLERIKEFKRLHVHVQRCKMNNEDVDFSEEIKVSRMYFSLLQNKKAAAFFESESELLSALSGVYAKLGERCNELVKDF